jgi:hypothetical protein
MALQTTDLLPLYRVTDSSNRKISIADFSSYLGDNKVVISDTPPVNATAGDTYWDTDTATMYIYYDDGSTSQWVPTVPSGSSPSPTTDIDGGTY